MAERQDRISEVKEDLQREGRIRTAQLLGCLIDCRNPGIGIFCRRLFRAWGRQCQECRSVAAIQQIRATIIFS